MFSRNNIFATCIHNCVKTIWTKMWQIKFVDLFGVKTVFSNSGALKTWRYAVNSKSDFSHKANTFLYDEIVKILKILGKSRCNGNYS